MALCGYGTLQRKLEELGHLQFETCNVRGRMVPCVRLLKDWRPLAAAADEPGEGGEGAGVQRCGRGLDLGRQASRPLLQAPVLLGEDGTSTYCDMLTDGICVADVVRTLFVLCRGWRGGRGRGRRGGRGRRCRRARQRGLPAHRGALAGAAAAGLHHIGRVRGRAQQRAVCAAGGQLKELSDKVRSLPGSYCGCVGLGSPCNYLSGGDGLSLHSSPGAAGRTVHLLGTRASYYPGLLPSSETDHHLVSTQHPYALSPAPPLAGWWPC